MKVVGLTGGIAVGKSVVATLLKRMGYVVIDADQIAREIVEPGSPVLDQLAAYFGHGILTEGGGLDRAELGKRVFGDPERLRALNSMTHPVILARLQQAIAQCGEAGEKMIFLEVPLLYETGMDRLCDAVIAVSAHPDVQLDRLKERSGLSEADCRARISAHWPQDKKTDKSTYVIDNSGHILQTESRLKEILALLRA